MAKQKDSPLDWSEIRHRAANFAIDHADDHSESSQKQTFWNDFFNVFGVNRRKIATFEKAVDRTGEGKGFIDLFWPGNLVVEHKSLGKNLDDAFTQAIGYTFSLKPSEMPRYIIVSDFKRFRLVDLETDQEYLFNIEDLVNNVELFGFIAGYEKQAYAKQNPVDMKAAEKMAKLHDELKDAGYVGHALEVYLVRLVFCLFAEDSGIFDKGKFRSYITETTSEDGTDLASSIDTLFQILNQPPNERLKNISDRLNGFPYVNGKLFEERLPVAGFDKGMRDTLLECMELDWEEISPAIFGSLFQGVMDPAERRDLGAHYTSEENILKLINPLFMDDLREELESIGNNRKKLESFWDKLTKIKILDPACGCGNFLIISYRELRKLEMDVMSRIYGKQTTLGRASKVTVDQFYGIEIVDFPSEIARVAMWLMDHLMNLQEQNMFGDCRPSIPLKSHANILNANSLTTDWKTLVNPDDLTYIIGNPPFIGSKMQDETQRKEMGIFFGRGGGILDYVTAWYIKATGIMVLNPKIKSAFVSTNSITQGEQVAPLWRPLFEKGIQINFAYRTFKWSNEAKGKAAVHVVIIGFSFQSIKPKIFLHSEGLTGNVYSHNVEHINAYLIDGPDVFLDNLRKPICNVPEIGIGNKPIDDGNYLFTEEEKNAFLEKEPSAAKYMKPWIGSHEFINGYQRYCLWLGECTPKELRSMPECLKRVEAVRDFRLSSKAASTRKLAETPTRFHVENMPRGTYVVIPETSSENRKYIPMGFLDGSILCSNAVKIMPDASLYHFGILTSGMHMAWTRYVCGRLESRYRYSVGIVYNNYPWPNVTPAQKEKIEECAQTVLDARKIFPEHSLADLYDPLAMPKELLDAHKKLDAAVEKAYRSEKFKGDEERVAFLFKLHLECLKSI